MSEQALKHRLKKASKILNISYNEAWHILVLERYLVRISSSIHRDKLIFKGGFLLAQYLDLGRETRDLDFLLKSISVNRDEIENIINDISATVIDDGFKFKLNSIDDLDHTHMKYPGYQLILEASFEKLKEKVSIDVGVGDVVDPVEDRVPLTRISDKGIFEDNLSILTYSPESIFAEKLETAVSRGEVNSRMKDYHDMILLIEAQGILLSPSKTVESIKKTFRNRGTSIESLPLIFSQTGLQQLNKYWAAHRRKLPRVSLTKIPNSMDDVVNRINSYLKQIQAFSIKNVWKDL